MDPQLLAKNGSYINVFESLDLIKFAAENYIYIYIYIYIYYFEVYFDCDMAQYDKGS